MLKREVFFFNFLVQGFVKGSVLFLGRIRVRRKSFMSETPFDQCNLDRGRSDVRSLDC